LRQITVVFADIAEIDAAGLRGDEPTFEQEHRTVEQPQMKCGRASHDAAADDDDVSLQPFHQDSLVIAMDFTGV
jgi:hypothetical protein